MSAYIAPLDEYRFVLNEIVNLSDIAQLPGCEEMTPDMVEAILTEAGRFCSEVLAPLNRVGDLHGASLENGVVRTAPGFKDAFAAFRDGGWTAINGDPAWGGQGLPWVVTTAVNEFLASANLAFSLCPMLSQGAIELLQHHGSETQKRLYLPRLNAGEWTGTMNLTEPQAGSDLGQVRTRAVREEDHYRITGQKIFITFGEHDFTENIIHMVLARTPDAPPGTRGISLFIVPKILTDQDGKLGARNDLRCVSLEHKLGIHASPTAVMSYGDDGGAIGYLVGEENHGLEYMFTMMNTSRLGVGIEGVGIAELATQVAREFARERIQGRPVDGSDGESAAIIRHPDVRRMLLTMRVRTEACRAVALYAAVCQDMALRHPEETERERMQERLDFFTPVVKAWSTETGIEVADLAVQIHGGVGYIEETGVAQIYRDGRITAIYEGTNGIQANDLVGRKIVRDDARALGSLLDDMRGTIGALRQSTNSGDGILADRLEAGLRDVEQASNWMCDSLSETTVAALAGATYLLRMVGDLSGGWLLARGVIAARCKLGTEGADAAFLQRKIDSANYYAHSVLADMPALREKIVNAGTTVAGISSDDV